MFLDQSLLENSVGEICRKAGACRLREETQARSVDASLYIYYAFNNRRASASDALRQLLSRAPFRLKSVAAELLAACVYWPLARGAELSERLGCDVANWPLAGLSLAQLLYDAH